MPKEPVIHMENIIKRFYIGQPNELEILHGIDLSIEENEFVSIVGESGSGKSTLMNIFYYVRQLNAMNAFLIQKGFPANRCYSIPIFF